jgi:hypothetical protein
MAQANMDEGDEIAKRRKQNKEIKSLIASMTTKISELDLFISLGEQPNIELREQKTRIDNTLKTKKKEYDAYIQRVS